MKIRGLLVALGLLIVLGGAIFYLNRKGTDSADKGSTTPSLLTVKTADIARIEIARPAGETTVLERDSAGAWKITAPVPYPTDSDAMFALTGALSNVASDKTVDEKPGDLSQYGLAPAVVTVTVRLKNGQSKKLLLGEAAAIGASIYASAAGDPRVYTVASYTKEALDKTSADLRDRRLMTFNAGKVTRVVLTAHKTATEFGKNAGGDWQMVKPRPYRVDGSTVDDLVRGLENVKLDPALSADDEKKATATFGSAAPVAAIAVTDAAGTQTLEIRKTKDDKYYARSNAVAGCYPVEAAVAKAFDRTLDDFRNKKLFDFGFIDPSRVEYHSAKAQFTASKGGEKWFRMGKPLESNSIQTFLDKLRDLTAAKFVENGPGASEIEISVVSIDGKKTEKVSLAKSGSDWLARRDGDASIYYIPGASVGELDQAAAGLKEDLSKPKKK